MVRWVNAAYFVGWGYGLIYTGTALASVKHKFLHGPTYSAITLSPLHRVYVDLFRSVESAHRDQVSIVSDDTLGLSTVHLDWKRLALKADLTSSDEMY